MTSGRSDPPSPDADPALELLSLLSDEFAAGGIRSGVTEAIGDVPAQLIVDVAPDLPVHVCFLPDHDQPPVLQYLVALDVSLAPDAAPDAARFLQLLNSTLPLTGFELSELASAAVFRYIQPVSVHPLDPGVIAWPLSMIHYAVNYYRDLVAEACNGVAYDDLLPRFEDRQRELLAD